MISDRSRMCCLTSWLQAFLLVCLMSASSAILAQANKGATSYPERPIRLVVPLAAGGAVDVVSRVIGAYLSDSLGQQVVIDNRPGGGGIIGTEIAAKAAPDGYTILMYDNSVTVMPSIFKSLPFNPKAFLPISTVSSVPFVLVVHPSTPFKTVADLVAAARAKPGELNFGSAGIGSPPHLAGELLASMAGVKMTHVPFRGAPAALTDVMAGRLQFVFSSMPLAKPQVDAGKVRALAVSTPKRASALPSIPTVDEAGIKGYDVTVWNGFFAPSGTRKEVITKLSELLTRALKDPQIREKLAARGVEPLIMTQSAFASYFQSEFSKWAEVVKRSGATAQ